MVDTLTTILTYASFVVAGAIVALNAIAPLTKNTWDNKFLKALVWVHDKLFAAVLPAYKVKPAKVDESK